MTATTAPLTLTVDIPAAFGAWFEDSSVFSEPSTNAARILASAYNNAEIVRRGRSHSVRLTTTDPEALWTLASYADTVVSLGRDGDFSPAEIRGAKAVLQRVEAALLPHYEAEYPAGAPAVLQGADDTVATVVRVAVDITYRQVNLGLDTPGVYHIVGAETVTLLATAPTTAQDLNDAKERRDAHTGRCALCGGEGQGRFAQLCHTGLALASWYEAAVNAVQEA